MADDRVSCVRAYERLWRSDVTDDELDRILHPGFIAHTPAERGTGREEFKGHLHMALRALSDLEARFEPVLSNGSRIAAHATIAGTHTGEFLSVAPTGKRLSWREVHAFDVRDRQIIEHWMDAALLAAYMQMIGQGGPDGEPPRTVPSGVQRQPTPDDHLVPITGYTNMVASHDASTVRQWATDDYLQHGPFGANVTRDEFEAGNRDIVWKALPDISIQLEPLLADGELVAARGLGRGTHTGAELFGVPATDKGVTFTETHIFRLRGTQVCEHWLQVDLLGLLGQLQT
jgi:predicted ester cyclase